MSRRRLRAALAALACALLAGCGALGPRPAAPPAQAAPAAVVAAPLPAAEPPPPEPLRAPPAPPVVRIPGDAVPRVERIAPGAPNRPYVIKGELYVPENRDVPMREIGVASWYGAPFHGRKGSNGERYDMERMTAAHPTMPLPSYARVRNLGNGREVVVRVNDRGPFHGGRVIDLSRAAARKLGFSGLALVEVERLTHADIASGGWRERAQAQARVRRARGVRVAVGDARAAPAVPDAPAR